MVIGYITVHLIFQSHTEWLLLLDRSFFFLPWVPDRLTSCLRTALWWTRVVVPMLVHAICDTLVRREQAVKTRGMRKYEVPNHRSTARTRTICSCATVSAASATFFPEQRRKETLVRGKKKTNIHHTLCNWTPNTKKKWIMKLFFCLFCQGWRTLQAANSASVVTPEMVSMVGTSGGCGRGDLRGPRCGVVNGDGVFLHTKYSVLQQPTAEKKHH